ncbi:MAG: hypothetical protein JSS82_03710 [Bacteroidetes bacterium]|nr:hypothetical protein [Bacteroidota bacterium]
MTAARTSGGTIFTPKQVSITIMTPEGREPGQAMPGTVAAKHSHIDISRETLTDDEADGPPPISNENLRLILAELYIDIS